MKRYFIFSFFLLLTLALVLAANPVVDTITLNTTDPLTNGVNENLTIYTTTSDGDGDPVKVIYDWRVNVTSLASLHLPFEGGSLNGTDTGLSLATRDYSEYNHSITVYDALWNHTGGHDGKGAYRHYNASTWINATNHNFSGNALTISVWVKHENADTFAIQRYVTMGTNEVGVLRHTGSTGGIEFYINTDLGQQTVTLSNHVQVNKWTHFVGTWDGSTVRLYVNGTEEGNSPVGAQTLIASDGETWIGDFAEYMEGHIDEVMILNRSLSPDQVRSLYYNDLDVIVSNETVLDETWEVYATPNDGKTDGDTAPSNVITIGTVSSTPNQRPTVDSISVNSTTLANLTTDNLLCTVSSSDGDADSVTNNIVWLKNGQYDEQIFIPFTLNNDSFFNITDYGHVGLAGTVWGLKGEPLHSATGGPGNGPYMNFNGTNNDGQGFVTETPNKTIVGNNGYTLSIFLRTNNSKAKNFIMSINDTEFYLSSNDTLNINHSTIVSSPGGMSYADNQWHHYAVVRNGSEDIKFYFDGSLWGTGTHNDSLGPTEMKLAWNGNTGEGFDGDIDEILFYNRTLTGDEISLLVDRAYDQKHADSLDVGENWTCQATPNDGKTDGERVTSNSVAMRKVYTLPSSVDPFGFIEWSGDFTTYLTQDDIDAAVVINQGSITINSTQYPDLNKPATVTFDNIDFNDVILTKGGLWRPDLTLTQVNATRYTATVESFSTYEVISSNWNGTHTNTTIYNENFTRANDVIASYSFDTSCTTADRSYNNIVFSPWVSPVWNSTAGLNSSGSCDTEGGYIYNANESLFYRDGQNMTISAYVHPRDDVPVLWSIFGDAKTSADFVTGFTSGNKMRTIFRDADTNIQYSLDSAENGMITNESRLYTYVIVGNSTHTNITMYRDTTEMASQLFPYRMKHYASSWFYIGHVPGFGYLNGTIDEWKFFDRALNVDEIANLVSVPAYYTYYPSGRATIDPVNISTYNPNTEAIIVYNVSFLGTTTDLTVESRADPSQAFVSTSKSGNLYTLSTPLQGDYPRIQVVEQGNTTHANSIGNYTFGVVVYAKPNASNLTIGPTSAQAGSLLFGNTTFLVNDTDPGNLTIKWYVNDLLVSTEGFHGLDNNTRINFTLNVTVLKDDIVYYNATPDHGDITGTTVQSASLTIGNTNYSYTSIPNVSSLDIQKPRKRLFQIKFTDDQDGDAYVDWYVNGVFQGQDTRFFLLPERYEDYEVLDISANISDGSVNNSVTWTAQITPPNVQAVGGIPIALFILSITAVFFLLPFFKRFSKDEFTNQIFKRCSWALAIYLSLFSSSIFASIAEYSGFDLTREMFRYMWLLGTAGWIFIGYVVIRTLFDSMKLWKIKKQNKRMGGER
jgi:hypothetical protein